MSDDLQAQIYGNLNSKETEDLLEIWQNGDPREWKEEVFEIIAQILLERLGYVPPPSSGRQVSQILSAIERHLDNNELDQALTQCDLALQIKPDLAIAYVYRGSVYDEMGQLNNAIADYQKAIQIDPEFKDAWDGLLSVEADLEEEFQESDAKRHLDQALEYVYGGERDKALEECETAKATLPGIAVAYNYLGMILQTLDRLEPAIDSYLKAIELNPRFYAARENLANARVQLEEEQYKSFTAEESDGPRKTEEEETSTEPDELQSSERSEDSVTIPQWHYMDRSAFLLVGWPGHRTRQGRSGYDPLEMDFELAHVEGMLIRSLITLKLRTRNPVYLLLMAYIGLIFCLPLLGLTALFQENWLFILLLIVYSPYWIIGIALWINIFLSLMPEESERIDKAG